MCLNDHDSSRQRQELALNAAADTRQTIVFGSPNAVNGIEVPGFFETAVAMLDPQESRV